MIKRVVNLVCVFTLSMGSNAYGEGIEYGAYTCIAQRVVGIQGDIKKGREYGKISLPPEMEKFIITITEQKQKCTDKYYMDSVKSSTSDEYSVWWYCDTKYQLEFSEGKVGLDHRNDGQNFKGRYTFRSQLEDVFSIDGEGKYTYYYPSYDGDFFLEEGVCVKPK